MLHPLCQACKDTPAKDGLKLVADCLKDIPDAALQCAIARYLTESETRWFPAVGTLRRYAAEYQGGVLPEWGAVWKKIMDAVREWDQFDRDKAQAARNSLGPLMEWVTMLGGFYRLANASADQLSVLQSNFRSEWTKQKQTTETVRRIPATLRPQTKLPQPVAKNLDSFGELPRIANAKEGE